MKKLLFATFAFFLFVFFTPQTGLALDTSHWKTYPVGRHLIKLPPSAELYWYPLRFRGQFDLVWKKGMTIEEAKKILLKEAEEAKKAPHESGKSQFVRMKTDYGLRENGIILMRRPHQFANSYLLQTYFVNMYERDERLNTKESQRVYYYEETVVDVGDMVGETIQFIDDMVGHVATPGPNGLISPVPGMYFDGGIFFGPGPAPYPNHEEIGIEARFPEHPGIVFKLFLDYFNMDGDPLFTNAGSLSKNTLRQAHTTIDGNPAQEILRKFERNGITYYSFTLNGPSKKSDIRAEEITNVIMHLENPTGGVIRDGKSTKRPLPKRSSFASDEEAMAFWDAIRKSVRWRPDHWRIKDAPKRPYYLIDDRVVLGPPLPPPSPTK